MEFIFDTIASTSPQKNKKILIESCTDILLKNILPRWEKIDRELAKKRVSSARKKERTTIVDIIILISKLDH